MSKASQQAKQEVIKHSAAIQIENNITLLQRRTWNALLYNAYNDLATQEEHSISIQELVGLVSYDSHDLEYLKEAALAMMRCIVQYNVLSKDGSPERWGAVALLAQVDIQKGIFTYAYSPELRRRLHNPAMYARLDLNMQKQFDSKHALALWELCSDYLGSGRDYGETPFIPLAEYRKLMGIAEDMYPLFKLFNKRVIKEPVGEINRVSDFLVSVDYQKQGRKVIGVKFKIRRVPLLPEAVTGQGKLFPDLEDMPQAVKLLKDAGLSSNDAWDIYRQGWAFVVDEALRPADLSDDSEAAFVQYIREKIHLLHKRRASGKVENSTGFLIEAIRQNYANPDYALELKSKAVTATSHTRRERERRLGALETQKADIERAREKELQALALRIAEAFPKVLEAVVPELMDENFLFREHYKHSQPALENYRERLLLQMAFFPYLKRHSPGQFETINQDYAARIAAIDAAISSLKTTVQDKKIRQMPQLL